MFLATAALLGLIIGLVASPLWGAQALAAVLLLTVAEVALQSQAYLRWLEEEPKRKRGTFFVWRFFVNALVVFGVAAAFVALHHRLL